VTVKRVTRKTVRKAVAPRGLEAAPPGLPPVLRASWKFARNIAKKFSREMLKDRADDLLKKLAKRFV
jgi:hypothetical protein